CPVTLFKILSCRKWLTTIGLGQLTVWCYRRIPCKRVRLRRSISVMNWSHSAHTRDARIYPESGPAVSPQKRPARRPWMSTGWNFGRWSGVLMLGAAVLCAGIGPQALAAPTQTHRKAKKKTPPPPLPSGPTGPVQQMPLDSIAAVPPQVTFHDNQLTIVAPNSTLADILRAVRKQTGAEIDVPSAPDRVVTNLGPGPAREVLADLLNGSRFNYVLLGAPGNEAVLTRVVLVPKQSQQMATSNNAEPQPGAQAGNPPPSPEQDQSAQAMDADATDESAAPDESAEQP